MICDCFTFFNELDLLEIRLNVLAEVVDRFVLVEARQTHQGRAKPLYYAENRDRFATFADRIKHVVVDDFPVSATTALDCEIWQRNAIQLGITDARIGDTILVSDVDEIPRPSCVTAAATRRGATVFRQFVFSYFLNYVHLGEDGTPKAFWGGTVAYRSDARAELPQRYRELRYLSGAKRDPLPDRTRAAVRRARRFGQLEGHARVFDDAGWHFTYQGGVESIIAKIEAYSHVEYNADRFRSRDAILTAIEEKRDLFDRGGTYEVVAVDARFPTYLQQHAASRYPHLLAPER